MLKFIVLILGSVSSILILKYRLYVKNVIGDIGFAEKYFGPGGTYTLIIIIGFLVFVVSLMYFAGTLQSIFSGPLGLIFGV